MEPWALVAERNDSLAGMLERALCFEGFRVSRVRETPGVHEELDKRSFELIFIDSSFTAQDGMESSLLGWSSSGQATVVLLADDVSQEVARRAVEIGAKRLLPRSVGEVEFRLFLKSVLAGSTF